MTKSSSFIVSDQELEGLPIDHLLQEPEKL